MRLALYVPHSAFFVSQKLLLLSKMTNLVGGFGGAKEADEEVHTLLADAKASVEEVWYLP